MTIRADVKRLESIADKLRSGSQSLNNVSKQVYSKVSAMTWEGMAYQRFNDKNREWNDNLSRTVEIMRSYASTLDALAEKFRQEDLEAERRERERRAREAAARAAASKSSSSK